MITTRKNKLALAALLAVVGSQLQAISPRRAKVWTAVCSLPAGAFAFAFADDNFGALDGKTIGISLGSFGLSALLAHWVLNKYTPMGKFNYAKDRMKEVTSDSRTRTELIELITEHINDDAALINALFQFYIDATYPLISARDTLISLQGSIADPMQMIHEAQQEEDTDVRVDHQELTRFDADTRTLERNIRLALRMIKQSDQYKKGLDDQERERKQRDQERMAWERVKAERDLAYAQQQNANATERLASTAHTSMSARQQQTPQVNIFGRRY